MRSDGPAGFEVHTAAEQARTLPDLARLLHLLRRRESRISRDRPLTYREIAAKTGWSRGAVGEYFAGTVLPPTVRFDELVRLLGATPAEQQALATARDRVEELRRGAAVGAIGTGPDPVPRYLPADVFGFTGRTAYLDRLDGLLRWGQRRGQMVIAVISGTAGVGKTALAVRWAHQVADQFPDGQLYANLHGFAPGGAATAPAEVVRGFLDAFGVPESRIPTSPEAQAGLYRSLLAGRRVLIILDNARDVDQIRPLLPGSASCMVVLTSRAQLTGLIAAEGAHPVAIDLLPATEAWQLLATRLSTDRMAAEPRAVDEIITGCARLPLALAVVAARAATRPAGSLDTLAVQLRAERGRLDAIAVGDPVTDVRSVFSWSYRGVRPDAAALFRLLGIHPGSDIGLPAAASLAGWPVDRVGSALAELAGNCLVVEASPDRFTCHDLLREYAAEQTKAHDAASAREQAVRRAIDHYAHTASAAATLLDPNRGAATVGEPLPGVVPEPIRDADHALAWFSAEHSVLLLTVRHCCEHGLDREVCRFALALTDYLLRVGHWHELEQVQQAALDAARRLDDRSGRAFAHRDLARALARLERYAEASMHYRSALELFTGLGDLAASARTHRGLGWMLQRQGDHLGALEQARSALELYKRVGNPGGQASALNAIGWGFAQLGQYDLALRHCLRALIRLRATDDRHGEANTWDSIGFIHHKQGAYRQAGDCYRRALQLYRKVGDRNDEAETLVHLAETHQLAGDTDTAIEELHAALVILDDLGHPEADRVHRRLLDLTV